MFTYDKMTLARSTSGRRRRCRVARFRRAPWTAAPNPVAVARVTLEDRKRPACAVARWSSTRSSGCLPGGGSPSFFADTKSSAADSHKNSAQARQGSNKMRAKRKRRPRGKVAKTMSVNPRTGLPNTPKPKQLICYFGGGPGTRASRLRPRPPEPPNVVQTPSRPP
jgi:hypothetical protein